LLSIFTDNPRGPTKFSSYFQKVPSLVNILPQYP
jgi:CRISPR/Cas system CMR-associated protein Cmr5 small subunit